MLKSSRAWMLAAAITLAGAANSDAATPPLHPLGTSSSVVQTDGVRYAAYKPQPDQLVLLDDETGISTSLPDAGDCEPIWGAAGNFLVLCADRPPPHYFVLSAANSTLNQIAGYGSTWDQYTGFDSIGAYWAQAETSTGGPSGGVDCWYLNWRTGARRYYSCGPAETPVGRNAARDLDSPSLRAMGVRGKIPLGVFADGSYVVRQLAPANKPDDFAIVLYRRRRRVALLARCPGSCSSLQGGAGRATWARGSLGFGYDIRRRRRFSWRLPQPVGGVRAFQHTRNHVFFSQLINRTPLQYSLFSAPWAR